MKEGWRIDRIKSLVLDVLLGGIAGSRTITKTIRHGPYKMEVVYCQDDPDRFYSIVVEAPRVNWTQIQLDVYLLGQVALRFADEKEEEPNP